MASVSDVPYIPRNEMSFCSCHILSVKKALFTPEKVNIDLFQEAESTIIQLISITSCGPTPFHDPISTWVIKHPPEKSSN
jgi:hypothetical protein